MTTFDFDGDKYITASTHQKEWGKKLIAELTLRGDETVLDLGCGDGVLTKQLAERVPRGKVVGVDASYGMLEAAQRQQAQNLIFLQQDINDLQLDERFDLIFSNAALHWITDHRTLLPKLWELLTPGGMLRLNFAADGNCQHFNRIVQEVMRLPEFAAYFEHFEWPWFMPTLEAYEMLLKESAFTDIRVWGENADRCFPDAEAITKWIDQPSLVPFLQAVDAVDKPRFREIVVMRMLQETAQADCTYFETFRRINVFAKK